MLLAVCTVSTALIHLVVLPGRWSGGRGASIQTHACGVGAGWAVSMTLSPGARDPRPSQLQVLRRRRRGVPQDPAGPARPPSAPRSPQPRPPRERAGAAAPGSAWRRAGVKWAETMSFVAEAAEGVGARGTGCGAPREHAWLGRGGRPAGRLCYPDSHRAPRGPV